MKQESLACRIAALGIYHKSDGSIYHKIYEKDFETNVGHKLETEIVPRMFEGEETSLESNNFFFVYRRTEDICFFIVASLTENELVLDQTCKEMYKALAYVSGKELTKSGLIGNYDRVFLLINEFINEGLIIETDEQEASRRVPVRTFERISVLDIMESFNKTIAAAKKKAETGSE